MADIEEVPLEELFGAIKRRFDKDCTFVCGMALTRGDGSVDYSIISGVRKEHRRLVQLLRVAVGVDVDQLFRGSDVEETVED